MKKLNKFILAATPLLTIAGVSVVSASCSPKKAYKYVKDKWKNRKKDNTEKQTKPTVTQPQNTVN